MLTTKKRPCFQPVLLLGLVVVALWTGCTPPGPSALLKGERLVKQERYSEAIVSLEQAVLIMPQEARAWNYLGLAYHQGNQRAKAVLAYGKALNLDRNLVTTRYNLGCAQFELGNYQPAIDSLNAFLALQSQANEASDAQLKIGTAQYELAIQATGAERNRLLDVARRTIDQVVSQSPSAEAHNVAGLIHVQRNRMREAVASFRAALQFQPGHAPALLNLAIVSQQYLNDRRAALQHYHDYLAVQPHPPGFAAVEEIARQLDFELNPPSLKVAATNAPAQTTPSTATNLVAVRTNQPPPTNLPVVVNTPTNRPRNDAIATQVAPPVRTNVTTAPEMAFVVPSTKQTPPATVAEQPRPLEFTRVPDDPRLVPANDFVPGTGPKSPAQPTTNSTAFIPGESQENPTNRTGVLTKLNPANWFTRKPGTPKVTELPDPTPRASEPGGTDNRAAASTRSTPAPVEFVPPRYQYMSPSKPASGDHDTAKVIFTRAANSHARYNYPEAINAYKEAVRLDPAYYEAWYNLGLAAYEANDLPSALLAGEQALAINPEATAARYNFALALQRANYPADAAGQLEKLLGSTPNEARAHLTLANLYARDLGQPARARSHYLRVLALDPRHPQATQIRYWLVANP